MSDTETYIILNVGYILMQFIGETVSNTSVKLLSFRLFNLLLLLFIYFFTIIDFYYVSGETFITALQSLITVSHIIIKYILLMRYKYQVQAILNELTLYNDRNITKKIGIKWKTILKIMNIVQVIMAVSTIIIVYMYLLRPLFNRKYLFALEVFVPDSLALDAIILLCQPYMLIISVPIVVGYDLYYLVLCSYIVVQVKLLKKKIKCAIDNESIITAKHVNICIDNHQFLLSIFQRMKSIYSTMLLFHYFVTLLTCCSDLFMMIRYPDLSMIAIQLLSLAAAFGQFAYYTLPAEMMASEFSDIAKSVYKSKWYCSSIKVQLALLIVMKKCQRIDYFSGLGFMDINVDTFVSAVKKTFSFYAIMKNVLVK